MSEHMLEYMLPRWKSLEESIFSKNGSTSQWRTLLFSSVYSVFLLVQYGKTCDFHPVRSGSTSWLFPCYTENLVRNQARRTQRPCKMSSALAVRVSRPHGMICCASLLGKQWTDCSHRNASHTQWFLSDDVWHLNHLASFQFGDRGCCDRIIFDRWRGRKCETMPSTAPWERARIWRKIAERRHAMLTACSIFWA